MEIISNFYIDALYIDFLQSEEGIIYFLENLRHEKNIELYS